MITINNYKKVESLEEAYELNQKKSNAIIGGMLWLKMGHQSIQTAIDLSGLGLDEIEETDTEFRIGCMTTLRQLEIHEGLAAYTSGAMKEALHHIVGVQFRNVATLGGSIYGRYGFSDVLTMFLAMDSYVELYKGGIIPLNEYVLRKYDRDIIVNIIVKKEKAVFYYQSVRNQAKTDFPVLACAAAKAADQTYRFSIGARPGKAVLLFDEKSILAGIPDKSETDAKEQAAVEKKADAFAEYAKEQIITGSNTRGSAEYRTHLIGVLVKRAVLALRER